MSNLRIAVPDIAYHGAVYTPSIAGDPFNPVNNLTGGYRYTRFISSANATSWVLKIDLGSNFATKNAQVDHLIIARADLLQTQGLTGIALARSSDDSAYTNEINDASFASATLYGPRTEDYIYTITLSSAYRYWRLTYTGASITFVHSKVQFGQFLQFDTDPDYTIELVTSGESGWQPSSGAERMSRLGEPVRRFTCEWTALSDTTIKAFENKVMRYREKTNVFLYTADRHEILDSLRVVHCRVVSAETSETKEKAGYNDLVAVFEEIVG